MLHSAHVAGFGTAVPGDALSQADMWDGFFARHFGGDRMAERIFRNAGVRRRHAAVSPLVEDASGWSTGRRMRRYVTDARPLGVAAVRAALADAGLTPDELGLFAVVSCTGYGTPGLDIQVAAELAMAPDLQRLLVGHMGCYAALPGLGVVADHVATHGRPAVALCLELTSLHIQPAVDGTGRADRGQVVAHALFGDAAAAVVLVAGPARPRSLEVVEITALTDPTTAEHMTWDVTDLGFRMGLSPDVPEVLARHVRGVVTGLLARHGWRLDDVDGWAVHPGGPRILDTVAERLELPDDALDAARAVLAERGNCSSATVLLVLDALRSAGRPRPGRPVVAMAFGPGLTLYAALLRGV